MRRRAISSWQLPAGWAMRRADHLRIQGFILWKGIQLLYLIFFFLVLFGSFNCHVYRYHPCTTHF